MPTATATLMNHVHGVPNNRCLHTDCQDAFRRWEKRYKLDKFRGIDRTLPADQARTHIAALEGAGWSRRGIAGASGISATAISRIGNGQRTIRRAVHDSILAIDPTTLPQQPSKGQTEPFVPRIGTVRRIQALLTLGWTHAEMHRRCGLRTSILLHQQGRWVTRTSHDKIAALYRALSATQGPSAATRARAAKLGYVSPAGWHNIDIDAEPDTDELEVDHDHVDEAVVVRILAGDVVPSNHAERREVLRRWQQQGRAHNELERLTGWNVHRYVRELREAS